MDRFLAKSKDKLRKVAEEHIGSQATNTLLGAGQAAATNNQTNTAARPEPSQNYHEAKRKVFWANDYFTSPGRLDQVEPQLAQADDLLQGDYSHEADTLRSEIAELREKVADIVPPAEESQVRSAERELRSVRDYIEQQGKYVDAEFVNTKLKRITDEILPLIKHPRKGDQLKAPILAEIDRIRAQIGAAAPPAPSYPPASSGYGYQQPALAPTPTTQYQAPAQSRSMPQAAAPPPSGSLSPDDEDRLNRARRVINHARSNIESRRTDGVENLFYDATSVIAPVAEAHKDHLLVEIEQLRKDLEATTLGESTRRITGMLDRMLGIVQSDYHDTRERDRRIQDFKEKLESEDVKRTLTPDLYREYENRLGEVLASCAAGEKERALERSGPELQELRDKLATNPFAGLDQYHANRVDSELRSLKLKVEAEVNKMPAGDYDRQRITKELEDLYAKFVAYSQEWGNAALYHSVREGWTMLRNDVEGWQSETFTVPTTPHLLLAEPALPKTRTAIRRVNDYLHGDAWVQRTRDEHPGDIVIAAIDREAQELLDAAAGKMVAAYNQILEAAEKMESPLGGGDQWIRDKAGYLLYDAEATFEKTPHCEKVVNRIKALDQRWKDEMSGVYQAREQLGEKLAAEAVEKWPAIVASIPNIVSSFDPGAAKPGEAVHLRGVYNRAGWDFDGGQYGFSMRRDGVPLGGIYEPYIDKAMEHAAYELKLSIDDHKEWDVVGVVLGPGSIKERSKRTIRIGMDYTEVEEWLPIECLRLRIIAVRAGPVVVGPNSS